MEALIEMNDSLALRWFGLSSHRYYFSYPVGGRKVWGTQMQYGFTPVCSIPIFWICWIMMTRMLNSGLKRPCSYGDVLEGTTGDGVRAPFSWIQRKTLWERGHPPFWFWVFLSNCLDLNDLCVRLRVFLERERSDSGTVCLSGHYSCSPHLCWSNSHIQWTQSPTNTTGAWWTLMDLFQYKQKQ